jgi:hypothetical protein
LENGKIRVNGPGERGRWRFCQSQDATQRLQQTSHLSQAEPDNFFDREPQSLARKYRTGRGTVPRSSPPMIRVPYLAGLGPACLGQSLHHAMPLRPPGILWLCLIFFFSPLPLPLSAPLELIPGTYLPNSRHSLRLPPWGPSVFPICRIIPRSSSSPTSTGQLLSKTVSCREQRETYETVADK